jgi:hypothetical protein
MMLLTTPTTAIGLGSRGEAAKAVTKPHPRLTRGGDETPFHARQRLLQDAGAFRLGIASRLQHRRGRRRTLRQRRSRHTTPNLPPPALISLNSLLLLQPRQRSPRSCSPRCSSSNLFAWWRATESLPMSSGITVIPLAASQLTQPPAGLGISSASSDNATVGGYCDGTLIISFIRQRLS